MRFLHTMLRVRNLDVALKFYQDALGLKEVRRIDNDKGRFTLVFLCAAEDLDTLKSLPKTRGAPLVELTYNWDEEKYGEDRYFGHLAYEVDDIYATCDRLMTPAELAAVLGKAPNNVKQLLFKMAKAVPAEVYRVGKGRYWLEPLDPDNPDNRSNRDPEDDDD